MESTDWTADPSAAATAWVARDGAPAPRAAADGVRLDAPFDRADRDRFYWDCDVRFDLRDAAALRLELTCDRPEGLRSLALYFRSGDGWYAWSRPLDRPGRLTLLPRLADFTPEGKPAGWGRIDRLRIAARRGTAVPVALTLHRLTTGAAPVLIVRGGGATANPAERRYAQRMADKFARRLDALGVPHTATDDIRLDARALQNVSVAALPLSERLPDAAVARLERFVRGGGRIMAFYSGDERLAKLMNVRLGERQILQPPPRWGSFVFRAAAAWGAPDRVYHETYRLHPARADAGATVAAEWCDLNGRPTGEPAWIESPAGLWMTHLMLDDDLTAREQMLGALLARLDPTLWPALAVPALERAGRIDSFPDFRAAVAAIQRQARGTDAEPLIIARLDDARLAHADSRARLARGDYPGAFRRAYEQRAALTEAYARAQQPGPAGELRGVWDHSGLGWYPGDWDRTCRELRAAGFNAIFVNLAWGGLAHYASDWLPRSDSFRRFGDQLEQCVAAARRHGLQVHVWKVCWFLGDGAPPEFKARLRAAGRLQRDADGAELDWLSPSHPENAALERAVLRELATRAPVDGIHLDYARYPDRRADFSPAARAAFERARGQPVRRWPADVAENGPHAAAFRQWRVERMNAFVADAARIARAARPGVRVSAAVWGNEAGTADSIGQDWRAWLRAGALDFVCPMNYTENLAALRAAITRQRALPGGAGRIVTGIGVTANESQLTADQVIEQILVAREAGAAGFVLFDLDVELRARVLPLLRLGVTAPAAQP